MEQHGRNICDRGVYLPRVLLSLSSLRDSKKLLVFHRKLWKKKKMTKLVFQNLNWLLVFLFSFNKVLGENKKQGMWLAVSIHRRNV